MNYEEICHYFDGLTVPLDGEDISDVIKLDNGIYTNLMTGKQSDNLKDIIRKRFVCAANDLSKGFYVFTDKHFLGVVMAVLRQEGDTWKWLETGRFFLSREYGCYVKGEIEGTLAFDICGQVSNIELSAELSKRRRIHLNYSVLATERIREYFGNFVVTYTKNYGCRGIMPYARSVVDLLLAFRKENTAIFFKNTYLNVRERGIHRIILGGDASLAMSPEGCLEYKVCQMNTPREAERKIEKLKDIFLDTCLTGSRNYEYLPFRFSIIQDMDGQPVQRCFQMSFECRYPYKNSEAVVTEYMRILSDKDGCVAYDAPIIWTEGANAVESDSYIKESVAVMDEYIFHGLSCIMSKLGRAGEEYNKRCGIGLAYAHQAAARRSWEKKVQEPKKQLAIRNQKSRLH